MKQISYKTKGTCAREVRVTLDGDTVVEVEFVGGCNGNTSGISSLVRGMNAREAIDRLQGIRCGFKSTSCPDQLARALALCLES